MVRAEHGTETAEAGDHLIGDQQHVVGLQHFLDRIPIAFRRRHDAAGAQHRFADEGGNCLRPFLADQGVELVRAPGRELFLAHGRIGTAEIVGRLGVDHLWQRQVELLVEQVEPGERARHQA